MNGWELSRILEQKWMFRPISLEYIPEGTGKIISVDETGTSNLKPVQKAIMRGNDPDVSEKTFTVTACMLDVKDYLESLDSIYKLKCKYWENGFFDYGKGDIRRVCFHSREIRRKEGPFQPGIIDYSAFIEELADLCAYPIYRHCVSNTKTKNRAFEAIERKLYHYPDYKGYGLIIFP